MFTLFELSAQAQALNSRAKGLAAELSAAIVPKNSSLTIERDINLLTELPNSVYRLREGFVRCLRDKEVIFFYEPGDLIGLLEQPLNRIDLSSDCAVIIDQYDRQEFLHLVLEKRELREKFLELLSIERSVMLELIEVQVKNESERHEELRYFDRGDPIIVQDTEPNEVYTLVSGEAEVMLGNSMVGIIKAGEIFGALAPIVGIRRTASVIAKVPCMVLALPKQHFLELAKTHPDTLLKLIEDMSKVIVAQNQKIVTLTN